MKHILTFVFTITLSSLAVADTWTVSATGKADFTTIQQAVNAASDFDDVLVMPGTYTGSGSEVVDMLGKEIWLHSSDGPEVTIINGIDGLRGIVCDSGETSNTVIEGFTVTDCWSEGGSAMRIYDTSPTVKDCVFSNNNSWWQGAVMVFYGSPTFEGCTFRNNVVHDIWDEGEDDGGAIWAGSDASVTLSNCSFTENQSGRRGGAIYFKGSGLVALESCSFSLNASSRGGAVYLGSSDAYISNCTFDANNANVSNKLGGAIYLHNAYGSIDSCQFTNNHAKYGGAIYNSNSTVVLANLEIHGNQATVLGGGIETFGTFPNINNSTICGNLPEQINGGWSDDGDNIVEDVCAPACPSDISGDGVVNVTDILELLSSWGEPTPHADVNSDGIVDVLDLLELIGNWGACE